MALSALGIALCAVRYWHSVRPYRDHAVSGTDIAYGASRIPSLTRSREGSQESNEGTQEYYRGKPKSACGPAWRVYGGTVLRGFVCAV
eukprot:1313565-Rhodomonas_salina.1